MYVYAFSPVTNCMSLVFFTRRSLKDRMIFLFGSAIFLVTWWRAIISPLYGFTYVLFIGIFLSILIKKTNLDLIILLKILSFFFKVQIPNRDIAFNETTISLNKTWRNSCTCMHLCNSLNVSSDGANLVNGNTLNC